MRQKRAKAYRKLMAQYTRSFGFHHPYQVLVNADFCETAVQLKMDLVKELETVLQGGVKPMITQCSIAALYKLGPEGQRIVDLAKTFERRRCGHLETPLEPDECMLAVVGPRNQHRYVVATQSESLRRKLREVEGVPLVCWNRAVMVLEMMSDKSRGKIRAMEEERLAASKEEVRVLRPALKAANKAAEGENPPPALPVARKKKPKGPNPLSVRRKKPVKPTLQNGTPVRQEEAEGDVKLGKRAREEDSRPGAGDADLAAGAGRKRKRRKKTKAGEGEGGAVAAGHEEDEED